MKYFPITGFSKYESTAAGTIRNRRSQNIVKSEEGQITLQGDDGNDVTKTKEEWAALRDETVVEEPKAAKPKKEKKVKKEKAKKESAGRGRTFPALSEYSEAVQSLVKDKEISKSDKIRKLAEKVKTPDKKVDMGAIANLLGIKRQFVYNVLEYFPNLAKGESKSAKKKGKKAA